jgi:hypothetical protein
MGKTINPRFGSTGSRNLLGRLEENHATPGLQWISTKNRANGNQQRTIGTSLKSSDLKTKTTLQPI